MGMMTAVDSLGLCLGVAHEAGAGSGVVGGSTSACLALSLRKLACSTSMGRPPFSKNFSADINDAWWLK